MNKLVSASGVVLFCTIPLRFIIEWMPLIGMPIVSTAMVGVEYAALLICIVQAMGNQSARKFPKLTKTLLWIYLIYSLYLVYDLIISPKISRSDIARAPESNFNLIQSAIMLGIIMSLSFLYNLKVDFEKWAKASCIFLTLMLAIYVTRVDLRLYVMEQVMNGAQKSESSMADYGAFDSLRLGWFCGINYVCNLYLMKKWTQNKFITYIIFWTISLFSIFICVATIQRGPITFIISTTIFYFYAKGYLGQKYVKILIPIVLLFLIFSSSIFSELYRFAPELMDRFVGTVEGGASGRFGSEDSAYSLAFNEFMMNPLFGHYFRFTETHGYFYGLYPHNILLESLMTMGLVFSIPFFIVLWKCVKNSYYATKDDAPVAVFGLLYIYILSTLMTSASMVLMNNFWIPLAVISAYIPLANKKRISYGEKENN